MFFALIASLAEDTTVVPKVSKWVLELAEGVSAWGVETFLLRAAL
jgi:hypothetical protein